jgi:hypothetical protein
MATKRRTKAKRPDGEPTVTDVFRAVQAFADRWKSKRAENVSRGRAWVATAKDGERLKDLIFGISNVLEGHRPWSDVRRMHIALERLDRGTIERRARVVEALRWALWIWRRTMDPKRRLEVADQVLSMAKSEHRAFGKLTRSAIVEVLTECRKNISPERLAARLSWRCGGFGDSSEQGAYENYRGATKARPLE